MRTEGADRRAAMRAFVRAHHPDVGGDPETFRLGLARLRGGAAGGPLCDHGGPPADDPRYDGPIVAVSSAAIHRFGRASRRLLRRCDPRPGSARVH